MTAKRYARSRGFTLVEMLVVVGIIILIAGLLMPALMKARRASRAAACIANLHQIGVLVIAYADANNDYTTLGRTAFLTEESKQKSADGTATEARLLSDPMWTCYPIVDGAYSAGVGPFIASGMLNGQATKILYCPSDADEHLVWSRFSNFIPEKNSPLQSHSTVRTSYFCRPINRYFINSQFTPPDPEVFWPTLLTRLSDVKDKAIFAERFSPPYSHGSPTAPLVNVLYADGSVRGQFVPSSLMTMYSQSIVIPLPDTLPPAGTPKTSAPLLPVKRIGADASDAGTAAWTAFDAMQ